MKHNSYNIDNFVNNKELNILKAVLPHLPSNIQRFMAIYIAMKELSNIFALLNAVNSNSFESNCNDNTNLDIEKILDAVKKHLDPSEAEAIDNYIGIMNMMKIMNEMSAFEDENSSGCRDTSSNDDSSNSNSSGGMNFDILKSMLSPEQSAIFDTLSNMN